MRIATVRTGVALLRRRLSTQDAANNETEEPQKGHVDGRIFHSFLFMFLTGNRATNCSCSHWRGCCSCLVFVPLATARVESRGT
jgi:hypothetical protein